MPSFIGSTVLNVTDLQRASSFWRAALGYVPHPGNPDFLVTPGWRPPSDSQRDHAAGMHLHLDTTDRMHLDLWVDRGTAVRSEVDRLVTLGARPVDWEYAEGAQHVVLADTEGNLFCVCG